LVQQFEALARQLGSLDRQAGDVSARSREANHDRVGHWVAGHGKDDGYF
jgi:hypothetical protein